MAASTTTRCMKTAAVLCQPLYFERVQIFRDCFRRIFQAPAVMIRGLADNARRQTQKVQDEFVRMLCLDAESARISAGNP